MAETNHTVEATGADVEAAVEAGLTRLGVARDAVEVEVLDEGGRGVFGLGGRDARVRLSVKPQPTAQVTAELPTGREPEREPEEPLADAPSADRSVAAEEEETEATGDQVGIAQEVLIELLALMEIKGVEIEAYRAESVGDEEEPPWILNILGSDVDALVGYRGKTMDALQRITRLIVGHEIEGRTNLVLDVGGFKARREKSLRRLAHRMAQQAARTNRIVALEPMPPNERRIIHLALRDDPNVTTESVGEDDRRKVTIIPQG